MAKNITLMGANYTDVPAVKLPQTGGGTATFYDIQVIDNLNSTSTTNALSANQGKVLKEKIAGEIPNNANLNSYTTTGVKKSPGTMAGVATLSNCPCEKPFIFIVEGDGAIGGTVQMIVTDGTIYTRRGTSQGFGKWYKFEGTEIN